MQYNICNSNCKLSKVVILLPPQFIKNKPKQTKKDNSIFFTINVEVRMT